MLRRFGERELISISDVTDLVIQQREIIRADPANLKTPIERVYPRRTG
jgi:hypothetical protein